jgi:CheY-like chemotaxis protein
MAKRVVLIEDDHLQAEDLEERLLDENLPELDIERIPTESSFLIRQRTLGENPPDLFIVDVMLRWTDPGPDEPEEPPDYLETGGYARAGIRLARALRADSKLASVPVILYTVLGSGDLEFGVPGLVQIPAVKKEAELSGLTTEMRRSLSDQ